MSGLFNIFKKQKQVFTFTYTIHQLVLNYSRPVRLTVIFQQRNNDIGKKRTETNRYPYSPSIGTVDLNEAIVIQHTLFKDKSGVFQTKLVSLTIQAYLDNNASKKVASLELDIAEFCVLGARVLSFQLKDTSDKNARIVMSISAIPDNDKQDSADSGTGTEGENVSVDSRTKKPPVYKEKPRIEDAAKINQLEQALAEVQRERDELKIKGKVKMEQWENEKILFKEQLAELDQRLADAQELYVKNKRKKIEYKKNFLANRTVVEASKKKINDLEDEVSNVEGLLQKAKNRKKGLKEQIKEVLQHEQKLTQDLIQFQYANVELSQKLKEKMEIKGPDIENPVTRSRGNTDIICNVYLAQLKSQSQILEDQKEAALTKQTELAFALQKLKTQYLDLEQKYKFDVLRLESELSTLRSGSANPVQEVILIQSPSKARQPSSLSSRKHKITELFKNVRELKIRKEQAENALKDVENGKMSIRINELGELSERTLVSQIKDLSDQLESSQKLLRSVQRDKSLLEKKVKVLIESESLDSSIKVIQEQLVACESEVSALRQEIEDQKSKHLQEVNKLLEKNCILKEKLKESEFKFSQKLKEVTDERDFIMKNARFSE